MTIPHPGRPLLTTALVTSSLAALLLAGCGRAPQQSANGTAADTGSSQPATSGPAAPSSTVASSPITSTVAASTVPPSTVVPTTARPLPTSSRPVVPIDGPGGCPTSSLKVMALRASGAAGHQYAFLQFTNISQTSCSLTGFPGVQLIRAGSLIGQPAARSAVAPARVQLAAGGSVTARLTDDSTCNADNSDSVQVYPPNRTDRIVLRLALRGCALHIDPVVAS